jgi:hypothetical protein
MKKILSSVSLVLFTTLCFNAHAQSTLTRVHSILQTNCGGSGCHGGSNPLVFDVSGTATDFYNDVVGVMATNPYAKDTLGHKLVDPGYPSRSFLLRKIAHGLSPDLALKQPFEGANMPSGLTKLDDAEIELVRQWIQFGAPQTGQVVDEQLLIDYYNGLGLAEVAVPAAPAPGEGFQIHCGPIFLAPNAEKEFKWRYDTKLTTAKEVDRLDGFMSTQSHHLILYKYFTGQGTSTQQGLDEINTINDQADLFINASQLAVWQYPREHTLPAGTSYRWEPNSILNSNFHVKNYSSDSILAAQSYINIYTKPAGSGDVEMFSELVVYGGFNPYALNVPNTGNDVTLQIEQFGANETLNFWILQAHTHKLGKKYEIYLRNSDGTKGNLIYDGNYNEDYTFNQGFYDYAHPPVLEFPQLFPVDMNNGLIHEATYNNNGPAPVGFGLTTNDEMFITYVHYTRELPTAIQNSKSNSVAMNVYPNPMSDEFVVSYNLTSDETVSISLVSLLGEEMVLMQNEKQEKGNNYQQFSTQELGLSSGIYFVRVTAGAQSSVRRIIVE